MANGNVNIKKLNHNTTMNIKVKVTRQFRIRTKIAVVLFKVAAFVLGCGVEIEEM